MTALTGLGADGPVTGRPDLLREVLDGRGLALPRQVTVPL